MLNAWRDSPVYQWMTWQEIGAEAAAGSTIAVAIGATEQHGPHLPVCTDWVIPTEILRQATRERHFVVGPTIPFGYRSRPGSGGGQHFPGTVSLRATTLMAVIEDVLSELVRAGFRKIVVYNWHFENVGFVYEPAALVSESHPDVKILVIEDPFPRADPRRARRVVARRFPGDGARACRPDRDCALAPSRITCRAPRSDGCRRSRPPPAVRHLADRSDADHRQRLKARLSDRGGCGEGNAYPPHHRSPHRHPRS